MIQSVVQRTLSDDDAIVLRAVDHLMTEGAGPYPVAIEVSRWRNLDCKDSRQCKQNARFG
jgi:hypothetical protein